MYNNLTKEDILDIVNTIKIGEYYKKKLRRINNLDKLQKEFSKILVKYDKYLKQKKYVNHLVEKRNKLKRKIKKRKIQKGGRMNYSELRNELSFILSELDNISIKNIYLEKINDIENIIMNIKNKKINLESKERQLREQEQRLNKLKNEMNQVKKQQDNKNFEIIQKSDMNPLAIQTLKNEKSKIEKELNVLKQGYRDLEDSSSKNLRDQELKFLEEIQQEKTKHQEEIKALNNERIQVDEKLKNLELTLTNLRTEKQTLEKSLVDKDAMKSENENIKQQEINAIQAKLQECNNRFDKFKEEQSDLETLKTQLIFAQEELERSENKIEDSKGQYELLEKEKANIENQLVEIKKQISNKDEKIQELNLRNGELQKQNRELEDQQVIKEKEEVINPFEEEQPIIEEDNEKDDPFEIKNLEQEKEDLKKQEQELENKKEILNEVEDKIIEDQEKQEEEKLKQEEEQPIEKLEEEKPIEEESIKFEDVSEQLKEEDIGQYTENFIENKRKEIELLEEKLEPEKVQTEAYKRLESIDNLEKDIEDKTSNTFQKFLSSISTILPKKDYEEFIDEEELPPLNTNQNGGKLRKMFGGGKKRKYMIGGATTINEIKNEINYKYTELMKVKIPNYNLVQQMMNDFIQDKKKYEKTIQKTSPKNITTILPKGVIVLYIRLIEDIMNKWERLGWGKFAPEDFSDINFNKLKNKDEQEQMKFDKKLKEFIPMYRKPTFQTSKIEADIIEKLENIYTNHYILLRKWFRKLKLYAENIRADQSFNISNAPKKLKFEFIQFDILRDILDDYQLLIRKPVSVYARVNDIGRDGESFDKAKEFCLTKDDFICKKVKADDYVMFGIYENKDYENYMNINIDQCNSIQRLKQDKPEVFNKFQRFSKLENATKFDEIFFSAEFSDNNTISRYMLLDKLIENGIGIFLVTYGYSGVGKSFTLFGTKTQGGLLQSTISNVKNIKRTKMRIFEIYGRSLPYSDGYEKLSDIDQQLVYYNMQISDTTKAIILKDKAVSSTDNINGYINSNEGFVSLPSEDPKNMKKALLSISDLVGKIEDFRWNSTPRRVKPTVNNPNSSRSILIYEFVFSVKLDDGSEKDVSFVIDDMPGLEDPIKTYVTENKKKIIFGAGDNFDYFYECVNQNKQVEKIRTITQNRNMINNNVMNYFEKNYFINELEFLKYPIQHYQELLLMSCLLNPIYIPILKPNDIFDIFNQQFDNKFRDLVLNNFEHKDKFSMNNDNTFQMENSSKFMNTILNLTKKPSVKITTTLHDKELIISSIHLMKAIIKSCIEIKNINPLAQLISKILFEEKIPSNPLFKEEIKLEPEDISLIYYRFQRVILADHIIPWVKQFGKSKLDLSDNTMRKLQNDKKYIQAFKRRFILGNNKAYEMIMRDAKPKKKRKINNLEQMIGSMLRSQAKSVKAGKIKSAMFKKSASPYYSHYVETVLDEDRNIKDAFEKVKEIELYKKKQKIIYSDPKMVKIVNSFVNIAFEAWYINQNIAGILKYYSIISNIKPDIINSFVPKQNTLETSLETNMERALSNIDNLFDSSGKLINLEINYYKIFCQIKNNTNSTALFQNQKQEEAGDLIVKDIINPYVQKPIPKISDFKMFYVLQNNNTQLKCLDQAELFLNTRKFINEIGQK